MSHARRHLSHRSNWIRSAVLGANDGIVSTASLIIGIAAAGASQQQLFITGLAGLVAGALSMAAGEYVSVQSQRDVEDADIAMEASSIAQDPQSETEELQRIYMSRGLREDTAQEVAQQLMQHNALDAHKRDDIGITETLSPRPLGTALFSALTFSCGAFIPLLCSVLAAPKWLPTVVYISSLFSLLLLGTLAAWAGGASQWRSALRVAFWGTLAMALTAVVGQFFTIPQG